MRQLYSLLFLVLLPLILLRLLFKSRGIKGYRQRWGERFSIFHPGLKPDVAPIWIHAVSVGECEAAFPMARRLLEIHPGLPLLMTCTTPTGSSRIRSVMGERVLHVYLPYDLPWLASRFLTFFRPRLGIIMETEIWPNLFAAAGSRHIPLVIANARLSEKSSRGYSRISSLVQPALTSIRAILAQTQEDLDRYRLIGAEPGQLVLAGNLKYDLEWTPAMAKHSLELRGHLFGMRKVFIAGSTHPGEEELVLQAFGNVLHKWPDTVLILVPRHPERSDSVRMLCDSLGYTSVLRTEARPVHETEKVLIVNGVGELRSFYGTSDLAYIGGSLVPHGGQNPLEPLIQGIPVLFGPHMANFSQPKREILRARAGREVRNVDELRDQILFLLDHPEEAQRMGLCGKQMIKANQGALDRQIKHIECILVPEGESSMERKEFNLN